MKIEPMTETRIKGVAASPGIAIGRIKILDKRMISIEHQEISPDEIEHEIERFNKALDDSKKDLTTIRDHTASQMGEEHASIFDAQLLMLEDDAIVQQTLESIRHQHSAEFAFFQVTSRLERSFADLDNDYLKSRVADLRDIKQRVLQHLEGSIHQTVQEISEPAIVIAREFTPSDTVYLDRKKILGFASDLGGRTSHAAILARSLQVPAVVSLEQAYQRAKDNQFAIIDGNNGQLVLSPKDSTLKSYERLQAEYLDYTHKLSKIKNLPARTQDGKDIELSANIEFPEEADQLAELGAQGVGLYRTEYLFLTRNELPSEEEQVQEYTRLIKKVGEKPLIIRTVDIGGDKLPDSLRLPHENNPFLGLRGIRLYHKMSHLLKTQVRAILRASAHGSQVRILFPMISDVTEIRECKQMVREAKGELDRQDIPYNRNIPIGAMIEVPSSAITADIIAKECDYLSIGTNDLIQYSLAVDRGNKQVAYLYQTYNPAIIRMIRDIIHKAHTEGVWVGMCGEMASDPLATMVLIGLGLDEFSVSPVSVLLIKELIRRVEYSECLNVVNKVLAMPTAQEIQAYLAQILGKRFQDLLYCQIISKCPE
jgi:phosphotransferase system enzyme I (PtsI)